MEQDVKEIQKQLNIRGYGPIKVDGIYGPATRAAVVAFQHEYRLREDGIAGKRTKELLFTPPKMRVVTAATQGVPTWPHQHDVPEFFGKPGGPQCTAGVVRPSLPLFYGAHEVLKFHCHEKVAPYIQQILDEAIQHYGEKQWRAMDLDKFSGCYNYRNMRGGRSLSMHAFGIAVDLSAGKNMLRMNHTQAQFANPEYEAWWRIVESFGAVSLGRQRDFDWMHFQFARL